MALVCSYLHYKRSIIITSSQKQLIRCKHNAVQFIFMERLLWKTWKNFLHVAIHFQTWFSIVPGSTQLSRSMKRKKMTVVYAMTRYSTLREWGDQQRMTALFLMIACEGGFGLNSFLCEGLTPPWSPLKNRMVGDTASVSNNPERCWRSLEHADDALSMLFNQEYALIMQLRQISHVYLKCIYQI